MQRRRPLCAPRSPQPSQPPPPAGSQVLAARAAAASAFLPRPPPQLQVPQIGERQPAVPGTWRRRRRRCERAHASRAWKSPPAALAAAQHGTIDPRSPCGPARRTAAAARLRCTCTSRRRALQAWPAGVCSPLAAQRALMLCSQTAALGTRGWPAAVRPQCVRVHLADRQADRLQQPQLHHHQRHDHSVEEEEWVPPRLLRRLGELTCKNPSAAADPAGRALAPQRRPAPARWRLKRRPSSPSGRASHPCSDRQARGRARKPARGPQVAANSPRAPQSSKSSLCPPSPLPASDTRNAGTKWRASSSTWL
jgi:hypothetical protein